MKGAWDPEGLYAPPRFREYVTGLRNTATFGARPSDTVSFDQHGPLTGISPLFTAHEHT